MHKLCVCIYTEYRIQTRNGSFKCIYIIHGAYYSSSLTQLKVDCIKPENNCPSLFQSRCLMRSDKSRTRVSLCGQTLFLVGCPLWLYPQETKALFYQFSISTLNFTPQIILVCLYRYTQNSILWLWNGNICWIWLLSKCFAVVMLSSANYFRNVECAVLEHYYLLENS